MGGERRSALISERLLTYRTKPSDAVMSQINALEKMLSQGKDNALVRYGLGAAYSALPDGTGLDRAVHHLDACIALDPNYSAAYLKLGQALISLATYDRAAEVFERGIEVAEAQGDKQAAKTMTVFKGRCERALNH